MSEIGSRRLDGGIAFGCGARGVWTIAICAAEGGGASSVNLGLELNCKPSDLVRRWPRGFVMKVFIR